MESMQIRIGGNDCQYKGRKIWRLRKDLSLDIECFAMVVPVFASCSTVDRSTRQGDLISIQSSVLD